MLRLFSVSACFAIGLFLDTQHVRAQGVIATATVVSYNYETAECCYLITFTKPLSIPVNHIKGTITVGNRYDRLDLNAGYPGMDFTTYTVSSMGYDWTNRNAVVVCVPKGETVVFGFLYYQYTQEGAFIADWGSQSVTVSCEPTCCPEVKLSRIPFQNQATGECCWRLRVDQNDGACFNQITFKSGTNTVTHSLFEGQMIPELICDDEMQITLHADLTPEYCDVDLSSLPIGIDCASVRLEAQSFGAGENEICVICFRLFGGHDACDIDLPMRIISITQPLDMIEQSDSPDSYNGDTHGTQRCATFSKVDLIQNSYTFGVEIGTSPEVCTTYYQTSGVSPQSCFSSAYPLPLWKDAIGSTNVQWPIDEGDTLSTRQPTRITSVTYREGYLIVTAIDEITSVQLYDVMGRALTTKRSSQSGKDLVIVEIPQNMYRQVILCKVEYGSYGVFVETVITGED